MTDIASGMAYLHSHDPVIIHRDLKSLNILVTNAWVAKVSSCLRKVVYHTICLIQLTTMQITDFGLSRLSAEADKNNMMTGQIGTFHWVCKVDDASIPFIVHNVGYIDVNLIASLKS